MKRTPELRPTLWDGLVVLLTAALALGAFGLTWLNGGSGPLTAIVSVDGTEIDRIPLTAAGEKTYQAGDYTLTAVFSPEGAFVREADCPTQDCVHTGTIRRGGQSVVCLPARFILRLEGGRGDSGGVDAVLG